MIVTRLAVEGWKTFIARRELGPFAPGLNVVHGPNGSGKSTLFLALRHGLLDNPETKAQEVDQLVPWGADLSPRVEIDFEHGGQCFRLRKQFKSSPKTVLERREGDTFIQWKDGKAAVATIREMLTGPSKVRALASRDEWGLAQILWAPQEAIALEPVSADVGAHLRQALATQLSAAGAPIRDAVEKAYDDLFQKKRGELKKHAALLTIKAELATVTEQTQALKTELGRFDELSETVGTLSGNLATLRQQRKDGTHTLASLRDAAAQFQKHTAAKAQAESRRDAATAQYEALNTTVERIAQLRAALTKTDQDAEKARTDISQLGEKQTALAAEKEAATADKRQVAPNPAARARDFNAAAAEATRLARQLADVEKAAAMLAGLREQLTKLGAPSADTLGAIRKLAGRHREAVAALEYATLTVEIQPLADLRINVTEGEADRGPDVAAGMATTVKGLPRIAFEIEGVARITARGPIDSADDLRDAVADAARELAELTAPLGTQDVDELEARRRDADAVEKSRDTTQARSETLLGSLPNVDALREAAGQAAQARDAFFEEQPTWRETPPDPEALQREHATASQVIDERLRTATDQLQEVEIALAQANEKLTGLEKQKGRDQAELTKVTGDGLTDAQRQKSLTKHSMSNAAAQAEIESAAEALNEIQGDPVTEAEELAERLAQTETAETDAEDKAKQAKWQLDDLAKRAPYDALARLEERIAVREAERDREQLHVDAIKLLHDTIEDCHAQAAADVAGPVGEMATALFHEIAGDALGAIRLGNDFAPDAVTPKALGGATQLTTLSGGEREQVHLAVRLALAQVLARDERQLVVLDDVLTYTDPERFGHILAILRRLSDRLQIVVLTCHPERYESLADAAFFGLADAV